MTNALTNFVRWFFSKPPKPKPKPPPASSVIKKYAMGGIASSSDPYIPPGWNTSMFNTYVNVMGCTAEEASAYLKMLFGDSICSSAYLSHPSPTRPQNKLKAHLPALTEQVRCPESRSSAQTLLTCIVTGGTLWSVIQHLNDDHLWSRDRIADWVETLDLDIEFKTGENQ